MLATYNVPPTVRSLFVRSTPPVNDVRPVTLSEPTVAEPVTVKFEPPPTLSLIEILPLRSVGPITFSEP